MPAGSTFANKLLLLLFNSVAIAYVADNAGTSPLTALQVSFHTADPGAAGTQTTSECNYTGYARVPVARDASGWTVTANSVSPKNTISAPIATGGANTAAFFEIGKANTGTGEQIVSGTITPNIVITSGVTPVLTVATTVVLT